MTLVFNKFLDIVASGLCAIAGPTLAPWRARREGQARIIAAKADATVMEVQTMAKRKARELGAPGGVAAESELAPSRPAG